MDFITFLVVLTYCSPKKYEIKGNIYGMLAEKIKYKLNSPFFSCQTLFQHTGGVVNRRI